MTMIMNFMAVEFLLDDQSDANAEHHPDLVADVSREMITIPFRPSGSPPDVVCPITLAWTEVWAWFRTGMSETWCNRFASSWARFLTGHAREVRISASGTILNLDQYVNLRRRTVGIHHSIDAAERSRCFEVPAQLQAHPLMLQMRIAAADTIAFMNDIHSLEREERRGDPHNLVTVLRRHLACSRQAAIDMAVQMTDERLATYRRLESQIPQVCAELSLTATECQAVDMGVEAIRNWIRGNYDWALATGRYDASKSSAAALAESRGRGSLDNLLISSAP